MPNIPETFWTDNQQAAERLTESLILHNDDVVRVTEVSGDGDILFYRPESKSYGKAKMSDPAWNKFRVLPRVGWLNVTTEKNRYSPKPLAGAVYLARRAVRSRVHGLNNTNVTVYDFFGSQEGYLDKSRILNLELAYGCGTYKDPEHYPSFQEVYPVLKERMSVALSPKFALFKDHQGLTWLYRKRKRVALVPNNASILLLKSAQFYREDIQDHNNILPLEIKDL